MLLQSSLQRYAHQGHPVRVCGWHTELCHTLLDWCAQIYTCCWTLSSPSCIHVDCSSRPFPSHNCLLSIPLLKQKDHTHLPGSTGSWRDTVKVLLQWTPVFSHYFRHRELLLEEERVKPCLHIGQKMYDCWLPVGFNPQVKLTVKELWGAVAKSINQKLVVWSPSTPVCTSVCHWVR